MQNIQGNSFPLFYDFIGDTNGNKLPEEISILVLSYLNGSDLARCSEVSKDWHRLTEDQYLRKPFLLHALMNSLGSLQKEQAQRLAFFLSMKINHKLVEKMIDYARSLDKERLKIIAKDPTSLTVQLIEFMLGDSTLNLSLEERKALIKSYASMLQSNPLFLILKYDYQTKNKGDTNLLDYFISENSNLLNEKITNFQLNRFSVVEFSIKNNIRNDIIVFLIEKLEKHTEITKKQQQDFLYYSGLSGPQNLTLLRPSIRGKRKREQEQKQRELKEFLTKKFKLEPVQDFAIPQAFVFNDEDKAKLLAELDADLRKYTVADF